MASCHSCAQECTGLVSGRADRKYHLPEGRRRPKACENRDELCRDEDASVDFGIFTDFEHAHAFLLLCSVPTALCHSLLCSHALRQPERFWKILTLHPLSLPILGVTPHKNDSEGLIWTAGSLLARKVCLPEGRGIFRVHCRDVLDLQTRDCPHRL